MDSDELKKIRRGHVRHFGAHNSLSQTLADWSVERAKQDIKLTVVYIGEFPERFS